MDVREVERTSAAWAGSYDRVFGPIFRGALHEGVVAGPFARTPGREALLRSAAGQTRPLQLLSGEQLPRVC